MSSWIIMGASILLILSMCYCGLVMFRVPVSKHFFQEKVINTSFCWDGSSPRASPLLEWAERFCFGFCFPFALYQEIVGTGIIGIIAAMTLIVMTIVVLVLLSLSWWSWCPWLVFLFLGCWWTSKCTAFTSSNTMNITATRWFPASFVSQKIAFLATCTTCTSQEGVPWRWAGCVSRWQIHSGSLSKCHYGETWSMAPGHHHDSCVYVCSKGWPPCISESPGESPAIIGRWEL